jgi:hypothetical protein
MFEQFLIGLHFEHLENANFFVLLMIPSNLNLENPNPIKIFTSLEDPNTQYISTCGLLII